MPSHKPIFIYNSHLPTVPNRSWRPEAVDKVLWKASSSGSDSGPASSVIDGDRSGTPFISRSDQAFPWIQVRKLASQHSLHGTCSLSSPNTLYKDQVIIIKKCFQIDFGGSVIVNRVRLSTEEKHHSAYHEVRIPSTKYQMQGVPQRREHSK